MQIGELIGNESAFPVLGRWRYFNHGGVCPLPAVVGEAMRKYVMEAEAGAYLGTAGQTDWYARISKLRAMIAGVVGCGASEIALLKNTSEGLATVAGAVRWKSGDRLVTTGAEYPSNFYPWMEVGRRFGVEVVVVPERQRADGTVAVEEDEILAAMDHPRTRFVAVSHVQFASGQRLDVARIGRACRERGVLFCVDGIQSVGVLPVDVGAMCIDFLAADGHKWMLGPEGAGFLYVRRALLPELEVPQVGWNSVTSALEFDSAQFELKDSAGRFECGTLTVPAFLGLAASVEMLAGVGVEVIAGQVKELTDRVVHGVRRHGWVVVSPREGERWSGIVAMTRHRTDLRAVAAHLRAEHGIELAVRGPGGGRLRVSPHFYNTEAEVDFLIRALGEVGHNGV